MEVFSRKGSSIIISLLKVTHLLVFLLRLVFTIQLCLSHLYTFDYHFNRSECVLLSFAEFLVINFTILYKSLGRITV